MKSYLFILLKMIVIFSFFPNAIAGSSKQKHVLTLEDFRTVAWRYIVKKGGYSRSHWNSYDMGGRHAMLNPIETYVEQLDKSSFDGETRCYNFKLLPPFYGQLKVCTPANRRYKHISQRRWQITGDVSYAKNVTPYHEAIARATRVIKAPYLKRLSKTVHVREMKKLGYLGAPEDFVSWAQKKS